MAGQSSSALLALALCAIAVPGHAESPAGAQRFCVQSLVPEPVVLASSCEQNQTLGANGELNVSSGETLWVVPHGATWECGQACPHCFGISLDALSAGSSAARQALGLEADAAEAESAVVEETQEGDGSGAAEELYDTVHEYVRENGGDLNVTSVTLSVPVARNGTGSAAAGSAGSQGCVGVVIEGPATFSVGATLLSGWGRRGFYRPIYRPIYHPYHPFHPVRRARRYICRNVCRWITWHPGYRRYSCKRSCFWGW